MIGSFSLYAYSGFLNIYTYNKTWRHHGVTIPDLSLDRAVFRPLNYGGRISADSRGYQRGFRALPISYDIPNRTEFSEIWWTYRELNPWATWMSSFRISRCSHLRPIVLGG